MLPLRCAGRRYYDNDRGLGDFDKDGTCHIHKLQRGM